MTDHPTPEERSARIAAIRATRSAPDAGADEASDLPRKTPRLTARRNPARAARMATVGGSVTAVLAMMAGFGFANRAEAETSMTTNQPDLGATPSTPDGTVRVPADTPVVVVVVDSSGKPIALEQMADAQELEAFLAVAQRVTPLTEAPAPAVPPTSAPASNTTTAPPSSQGITPTTTEGSSPAQRPAPAPEPVEISLPTPVPAAAPAQATSAGS